jgi:hypothetical protein
VQVAFSFARHFSIDESLDRDSTIKSTWEWLVTEYSATSLSYPNKDNFVAFSAVADSFRLLRSSQYAAGFFYEGLPQSLMWEVDEEQVWQSCRTRTISTASISQEYRAPSWSCARRDDPISFFSVSGSPLVSVVDLRVKLLDKENPSGRLMSVTISLQGITASVLWEWESWMDFTKFNDIKDFGGSALQDRKGYVTFDDTDQVAMDQNGVVAVPILSKVPSNSDLEMNWRGLVLKPLPGTLGTGFVRIGTFTLQCKDPQTFFNTQLEWIIIIY